MARTFSDSQGTTHNLDHLMDNYTVEVDCHTDIVTGEASGYVVLLDGEERFDIEREVYEALSKIL